MNKLRLFIYIFVIHKFIKKYSKLKKYNFIKIFYKSLFLPTHDITAKGFFYYYFTFRT